MRISRFLISNLALCLAACGGGGTNSDPGGGTGATGGGGGTHYCVGSFVNGSASTVSTTACNNCTIHNNQATVDDSSSTFATLTFGANGGQITIRADAPSGMSFPSGSNSGALMLFPTGSFQNIGIRFNTYSNGVLVDSLQGGTSTTVGQINGAGVDTFYGISPSATINSLEAVVSLSGNTTSQDVRLYEFCGEK